MRDVKSLLQSRTFWVQLLGLVALIAAQFHLTALNAWVTDPNTVSVLLNFGGMLSLVLGVVFRVLATKQITSVLPEKLPPVYKTTTT